MSREHFGCDRDRLRALLDGRVAGDEEVALNGHLDGCTSCQRALEGLAAEGRWWDRLRRIRPDGDTPGGPDAPGSRGLRDNTPTASGLSPFDETSRVEFLTPSDDPQSIGRFGPFEISRVLGQGGMGVVLEAFDRELNRPVALKVLAPHLAASGAARQRFAREAKAAAAVVHEHVVTIHAVDEAGGLPYLVMQHIKGTSLQERIDRSGPLPVEEVLRIGTQAAQGLAAAHAQGLVHRDIKPSNILLENGVERVKLTDFGLARAVDDASLTRSGVVAGTPQYMAPEQARGESVDRRSDLFSLGSVLYAMCCGHAPFRAGSAVAVLRRVSDDPPRPVREVNPSVPASLAAVIGRLHAKDPAGRYGSAEEVARALAGILAGLQDSSSPSPAAVPVGPPAGDGAWAPRRTFVWGFALAAPIAIAVAFGVSRLPSGVIKGAWTGTGRAAARAPDGRESRPAASPSPVPVVIPSGPVHTIKGTVRDRATGIAIPNVRVKLAYTASEALTDADGRYTLRGAVDAKPGDHAGQVRFVVWVEPTGPPYFASNFETRGVEEEGAIRADFALASGTPFRIRLVDGPTGGPVRSARVIYWPLRPNPHVDAALAPGSGSLRSVAAEEPGGWYSGVALPGPGAICVESYAEHYGPISIDPVAFFEPGRTADEAADGATRYGNRGLFAVEPGSGRGTYLYPQDRLSGAVLIHPRAGEPPIERRLVLRNNRDRSSGP